MSWDDCTGSGMAEAECRKGEEALARYGHNYSEFHRRWPPGRIRRVPCGRGLRRSGCHI